MGLKTGKPKRGKQMRVSEICKHCSKQSKGGKCMCKDYMTCSDCPMPRRVMLMDMEKTGYSKEESE